MEHMNADFSKPYDPKATESMIYQQWLDSGYFNPDNLKIKNPKIQNYVVYMPLPNVTGTLHMGHALDNTGSDILVRYYRMKGFRTLWLPGTDHAGIATQYKVEKELRKEGASRFELGREKFIERVWKWKEEYGGIIIDQLKKLGASADWSRLRFTMDPDYTKDVLSAFVHYYEKGLIYRGERTVNWCPRCGTSLSELELEHQEEKGSLWYIKYPLIDTKHEIPNTKYIIVATTRPETMLGDTAVAVNPNDKRYAKFIGKTIRLPLTNREIPIVADLKIDPGFGTGAVKVTPAHDILDFEIGGRHKLASIQVIDERGKMNANAGSYAGMKTEEARKAIVERLASEGLLEKEESYVHNITICYRCGHVIEPIPSMQWFLQMDKLAANALKTVQSGKVDIQPENFQKIYFDWLENIRDWTISRQLWWGHQLPVWFCKNQTGSSNSQFLISNKNLSAEDFVVSVEKPATCPICKNCDMIKSPDVLDTWFSSALWPFAGLSESDRKNYYPGNFVSNARDILNLWDARMIFSGLEFMGKPPFQNVFVHGTILTKDGKRMSKSLGTGIDPLKYIDQYGADATRFAVIWQANGQDIHWDEAAVMAGRKFCNKIWNASRFVLERSGNSKFDLPLQTETQNSLTPQTEADKKILAKLAEVKKQTERYIETFEFAKALQNLYDFFWHDFCDIYLEESKGQIADEKTGSSTQAILRNALVESLKMLHPFMPFVTEAVYQNLDERSNQFLMTTEW
jgi:valyl-tRNA synthetase